MTFSNVTPEVFAGLKKQLAESLKAKMTAESTGDGEESGAIIHDQIQATYTYAANTLTVDVTKGGFLVKGIIQSRIGDAIAKLQKG